MLCSAKMKEKVEGQSTKAKSQKLYKWGKDQSEDINKYKKEKS
jgi:hypothetical protein